uniref:MmgE/PrpD family protein 4 n=1 Tax=Acidicaldus sp. TaxID=1872105 RepID=A0A8J4HEV6_9PROT
MTLAARIARFTTALEAPTIPTEVLEKARTCLLNAYGIGLGGHATPYAPVARRAALAMEGEVPKGATLLGDGRTTTIGGACLANAALFHGRAQEDTCGAAHFGTILIPLLTALLEARRYPMARLLPALVAGYEVGGLLEKAYAGYTTPSGFRSSALYGVIAAAAAAARMMEFSAAQTAAALANAVSFTGGVLQSFADGTDEWRYQVGQAGRTGLAAAELARAGSVSAPLAFEGKSGLVRAFAGQDCEVGELAASLGDDWAMLRVAFKPYPVCAFNQTPVMAALALREQLAGTALAGVRVRMNPYEIGYAGMDAVGPFHTISGTLMSIPFCIATTLLHGAPDMRRMTTYDDPEVATLIRRIQLVPDPTVPVLSAVIEAETADFRCLVREQRMTPADYSYDRATVSAMVRRIGGEEGVPVVAFDRVEAFVARLPDAAVQEIVGAFALLQPEQAFT